jgi:hypothetical protein
MEWELSNAGGMPGVVNAPFIHNNLLLFISTTGSLHWKHSRIAAVHRIPSKTLVFNY